MKLNSQFLQTPTGQLVVVGVLAAVAVGAVAWQRSHRKPVAMPTAKVSAPAPLPKVFQRIGAKFEPTQKNPPTPSGVTAPAVPEKPAQPPVLPLTLFSAIAAKSGDESASRAPYGRMIPCETVVTLESNRLATPVIGLVTEDVWENGQLIVPAGAEVHGRASLDRSRERLAAEGSWTIVWRTVAQQPAHQLRVEGLALDRKRDRTTAALGEHDGTAGLRGQVLRTDDLRELKLFAATFLSTATMALQDTRSAAGLLGETSIPASTARNASLAGTSAILREYAQQLRDAIARDGFYVRVPAGKAFYLYVTQSFGVSRVPPAAPTNVSPPPEP